MALTDLLYHIVFSTKNRQAYLTDEVRPKVLAYLVGVVRGVAGHVLAAGGARDHVHLLVVLPPTVALASAVRTIKTNSSKWTHETWPGSPFAWQAGYAAFTVGRAERDAVLRYVQRQEEHHRQHTFEEEFVELLQAHGVEYDPRYLWG